MTEEIEGVVGSARTRDGIELHTLRWPAVGRRRAGLVLVHGIAEHIGRYAHVGPRLAQAGIETRGYDQRGFGASAGRRAYVERWSRYHDDLEDQLAATPSPKVLYGHSMGGLVALGYVLALPPRPKPELLVLSAPAIVATVARWKRAFADLLGRVAPHLEIPNDLPPGGLSHDARVEDQYRSDPLNVHRTTARLGMELFHEQTRVRSRLANNAALVPTYVLHGAEDPIVPLSASALLGGRENVTRRVYPGLRHETHNEAEAATVIGDTIAWIEARLASAPPAL